MKFSTVFTTVAALASSASAGPVIAKREFGGVTICTGADYTGDCYHKVVPVHPSFNTTCNQLPEGYVGNVQTFAPDAGAFACSPRTYSCPGSPGAVPCKSPTGCTFGEVDSNYEHKTNLTEIGWNKLIRSFDCHPK